VPPRGAAPFLEIQKGGWCLFFIYASHMRAKTPEKLQIFLPKLSQGYPKKLAGKVLEKCADFLVNLLQ
jgi:hypothetical protein